MDTVLLCTELILDRPLFGTIFGACIARFSDVRDVVLACTLTL